MRENRTVLIGVVVIFVVMLGIYYLYQLERRHQENLRQADQPALDIQSSVLEERSSRDLEVVLYFYRPGAVAADAGLLVAERRPIFQTGDPILKARQIIHELLMGPKEGGQRVFPEPSKLRQVYLLQDGTAVVDLTRESTYQLGGVIAEWALLYSVTRSLVENVEEVKRVRFLVEGQERPTFAGHVCIRHPFM